MTLLTYLAVHAQFVIPPLAALAAGAHWRRREHVDPRVGAAGTAVLVVLALAYTTPWDRLLIRQGVWWYGTGRVAGRLWGVPYEELLFFVLQTLLTALWTLQVDGPVVEGIRHTRRDGAVGAAAGLAVSGVGVALLAAGPSTLYLGAILAWAGPVLAIQWAAGWRYLLAVPKRVALAVSVPTVYFWGVDRVAIEAGVWIIAPEYTTGLAVAGLPVEEMAFFLVTNLFVVQGLVLFRWVVFRWR
ncbi:MAG: lycopene cyclase domain-containing protein [Haloarculaceae archaeon]